MIPKYRKQFNQEFSPEKYQQLKDILTQKGGIEPGFRISESPIFLTKDFENKLLDASESVISQIKAIPAETLQKAIPENCKVPNDTDQPHFFTIDFGICRSENGEIEPQLIELQAFPSLYAFQKTFENTFCEVYPFLSDIRNTMPHETFKSYLKDLIVGGENPENVIILEILPEKQKTAIDFALTEQLLGIKTLCLTKVKKKGKKLYYENNGEPVEIKRIYNRVIFDELDKTPDLVTEFDFREEVDVKWITHPNWFFKISKFLLPLLQHQFVPKSYFLHEFPEDESLENFVLKPLFSFAGSGVNLNPTKEITNAIDDKENYILQRKVTYEPVFEDINGDFSKAEIRLLYIWRENDERPILLENLGRMTKAAMINVDFNKKDAIWIGSSNAFFGEG
ncbi:hypothetical protein C1637_13260 [Chryseobacterium lactis]|uniref:Circularly permuted type 2 ATP-grasp protein n=1 Tax=Chryseobacterium lactis TaxID=1241981 RepID=A0A3G6RS45_CHRLC|nr:hypothetical protein [Chryseobacterium lactis]AZA83904.1 hypothetical protein EG342_19305 [Chryseobacterium lactis]AZB04290.1 hypothetical protein EG341_10180 [Chryseobacterium lactis]PNW12802.1 hypothetical protein C1637_13260 [Chryseobacterium lactis]